MNAFIPIDTKGAKSLFGHPDLVIVDIRDPASYEQGHIAGAVSLGNDNMEDFLTKTDKSRPVLCYCYHGISSQAAGQYLAENGFATVYSLNGGYEQWRHEGYTA